MYDVNFCSQRAQSAQLVKSPGIGNLSQVQALLPAGCFLAAGLEQASHSKLLAWVRNTTIKIMGGPNHWIIRVNITPRSTSPFSIRVAVMGKLT